MTAAIGIKRGSEIDVITVEKDGNPAFAGATLYAKYQKAERVAKLIELGDLVKVGEKLNPKSSLGHYILTDEKGRVEQRLQEGVCISKYRDVHQIKGSVVKRNKRQKARVYSNLKVAYICEGVDYLYIYDTEKENWVSWGLDYKTGAFKKLKIHYIPLIKNLIYRDDISLTEEEKEGLSRLKD